MCHFYHFFVRPVGWLLGDNRVLRIIHRKRRSFLKQDNIQDTVDFQNHIVVNDHCWVCVCFQMLVVDNFLYHVPKTSLLIYCIILTMIDHIWNYLIISPQNYHFKFWPFSCLFMLKSNSVQKKLTFISR